MIGRKGIEDDAWPHDMPTCEWDGHTTNIIITLEKGRGNEFPLLPKIHRST